MDNVDYGWCDFLSTVGKRLTGIVYLSRKGLEHVYFTFEDGTGSEIYSGYQRLCPKKNNWGNVTVEYFINMAKNAPRGSTAYVARLNADTNEVIQESIECIGESRE